MTANISLVFYLACFITSIFHFSFYNSANKGLRNFGLFISIFIPSLLAGMRYGVGTDFFNYDYNFNIIRQSPWSIILDQKVPWEFGFKLLIKILSVFFNNSMIFFVIAFLTLSLFVITLNKYYNKQNIIIAYSIFIFCFFPQSLNITRQMLAIVIIFYAYNYIFEKKFYQYILLCFLASTIHLTAFIAVPVYFLWNSEKKNIEPILSTVIIIVASFLSIFYTRIIFYLAQFIPFLFKYEYLSFSSVRTNRDFYLRLIILIFLIFMLKYIEKIDQRFNLYILLYSLALIIGFTGFSTPFFKRLIYYFTFPITILMCPLPRVISINGKKAIVSILITVISIIYFILIFYIMRDGDIFPLIFR